MADAMKALGGEASRVQPIFVTVDPARNSSAVMKDYVKSFDDRFVALRGPAAYTDAMVKAYNAKYEIQKPSGDDPAIYNVDHTASIAMIGPDGVLRKRFPYGIATADHLCRAGPAEGNAGTVMLSRRQFAEHLAHVPCRSPCLWQKSISISAAVLAITHAQPRSLDALLIKGESGAISLTAFRGRIVILNMWATWCLPCRREMPSLLRLKVTLRDTPVDILPVALDRRGLEAVRGFYVDAGITNLPALSGDAANLQEVTPNVGLPSTYILDGDGLLRWSE